MVRRCPAEVQYSCVADGLQAATGASPGKLTLRVEEVSKESLSTTVRDRTVTPAQNVTRAIVFGLLTAFFVATALTIVSIGLFRLVDVYLPGGVWASYLVFGGIFVATTSPWFGCRASTRPSNCSLLPLPYASAVSKNVQPSSIDRSIAFRRKRTA